MSGFVDFLKALAGICETRPLDPDVWDLDGDKVRVHVDRIPDLRTPGSAGYIKGKGLKRPVLIVKQEDGGYLCVANRCTHAWRKLDPVPGEKILRCCSVNHSRFDYQGKPVGGPAKKPLTVYQWEAQGGDLVISV